MAEEIPIYARIPRTVDEALAYPADNDFAIAMRNLLFARERAVSYDGLNPAERVVYCLDSLESGLLLPAWLDSSARR